jgi:glutaredoxin-related protein
MKNKNRELVKQILTDLEINHSIIDGIDCIFNATDLKYIIKMNDMNLYKSLEIFDICNNSDNYIFICLSDVYDIFDTHEKYIIMTIPSLLDTSHKEIIILDKSNQIE